MTTKLSTFVTNNITVGGNNQLSFNHSGQQTGSPNLTFDSSSNTFAVGSATLVANVTSNTVNTATINSVNIYTSTGIDLISQANAAYSKVNLSYAAANSAQTYANTLSTSVNTSFATVNSTISQANSAISTLNTYTGAVNSAFSATNTNITAANSAIASVNAAIANINTNMTGANTAIASVNAAIANINTNITAANTAIASINAAVANINTNITAANSAISALNSAASTTNTTFGTVNTNISTVYTQANLAYAAANASVQNSGGTITGSLNVNSNLVVGNLFVTGTTTNVNTTSLIIDSNTILLAANQTSPIVNAYISVERGGVINTSIIWNETTGQWGYSEAANGAFVAFDSIKSLANTGNNTAAGAYAQANLAYSQANNFNTAYATDTTSGNNYLLGVGSESANVRMNSNSSIYFSGNTLYSGNNIVSGYMGIGTSSPGYTLDVNGQARFGGSNGLVTGVGTGFASGQAEIYSVSTIPMGIGTTGSAKLNFYTNSTLGMTLDANGNFGLGATANSSWGTSGIYGRAFQLNNYGALSNLNDPSIHLTLNQAWNGSNWFYLSSNYASKYTQYGGTHMWYVAPSGTAGNTFTPTQVMALDNSGNFYLGTTSQLASAFASFRKDQNATYPLIAIQNSNSGASSRAMLYLNSDTASGQIGVVSSAWNADTNVPANHVYVYGRYGLTLYADTTGYMKFLTNSAEAMRIDSSGNVLIGTTGQLSSARVSIADASLKTSSASSITLGTATGGSNDFQLLITRNAAGSSNSYYGIQSVEQSVAYRNLALQFNGGNVGIGTTTPSYTLDVSGSGRFTSSLSVTGVGDLILNRSDGYDMSIVLPTTMTSNNKGLIIQQAGGGNIYKFSVVASTTYLTGGNVYIGGTYYDNDNTGYYVKPSSNTVLNYLNVGNSSTTGNVLQATSSEGRKINLVLPASYNGSGYGNLIERINFPWYSEYWDIAIKRGGSTDIQDMQWWLNGTTLNMNLDKSGNLTLPQASLYVQGTIYDNSNTGYYIKPSNTSQINNIYVGDSNSRLWFGPSGGTNYIESGNAGFTASADLRITGYNSNAGGNLYLNFNNIYSGGTLYTNVEQYNQSTGSVAADSAWHTILSGLSGHHTFWISVDYGISGYHDTGIIEVACVFAVGKVTYMTAGSGTSSGYNGISINARISGSTYNWNVDLSLSSNLGSYIYYKIKEQYA